MRITEILKLILDEEGIESEEQICATTNINVYKYWLQIGEYGTGAGCMELTFPDEQQMSIIMINEDYHRWTDGKGKLVKHRFFYLADPKSLDEIVTTVKEWQSSN